MRASIAIALLVAGSQMSEAALCVSQPLVSLVAGLSNVSAVVNCPSNQECQGLLQFVDPDPGLLTYNFETTECMSSEMIGFTVPSSVPSGLAYLIWQCTGQLYACISVVISSDNGNPAFATEYSANATCPASSITNWVMPTVTSNFSGPSGSIASSTSLLSSTATGGETLNTDDGFSQTSGSTRHIASGYVMLATAILANVNRNLGY